MPSEFVPLLSVDLSLRLTIVFQVGAKPKLMASAETAPAPVASGSRQQTMSTTRRTTSAASKGKGDAATGISKGGKGRSATGMAKGKGKGQVSNMGKALPKPDNVKGKGKATQEDLDDDNDAEPLCDAFDYDSDKDGEYCP